MVYAKNVYVWKVWKECGIIPQKVGELVLHSIGEGMPIAALHLVFLHFIVERFAIYTQ